MLLEQDGLALDAKTAQSGETALIYAARSNYPTILNLLLDAGENKKERNCCLTFPKGANANISGSEGTALDVAVSLNRREAAKVWTKRREKKCVVFD